MSGSLLPAASSRVHWRFAATMLKFAFTGKYADIDRVRQTLSDALASDGWLLESPSRVSETAGALSGV